MGLAKNYHTRRLLAGGVLTTKEEAALGVQEDGGFPFFVVPDLLESSGKQGESKSTLMTMLWQTRWCVHQNTCTQSMSVGACWHTKRTSTKTSLLTGRPMEIDVAAPVSDMVHLMKAPNSQRWKGERRRHLERQNSIREEIINTVKMNPKKRSSCWTGIEADIGHGCSAPCIWHGETSHDVYCFYSDRVIPLLSNK